MKNKKLLTAVFLVVFTVTNIFSGVTVNGQSTYPFEYLRDDEYVNTATNTSFTFPSWCDEIAFEERDGVYMLAGADKLSDPSVVMCWAYVDMFELYPEILADFTPEEISTSFFKENKEFLNAVSFFSTYNENGSMTFETYGKNEFIVVKSENVFISYTVKNGKMNCFMYSGKFGGYYFKSFEESLSELHYSGSYDLEIRNIMFFCSNWVIWFLIVFLPLYLYKSLSNKKQKHISKLKAIIISVIMLIPACTIEFLIDIFTMMPTDGYNIGTLCGVIGGYFLLKSNKVKKNGNVIEKEIPDEKPEAKEKTDGEETFDILKMWGIDVLNEDIKKEDVKEIKNEEDKKEIKPVNKGYFKEEKSLKEELLEELKLDK